MKYRSMKIKDKYLACPNIREITIYIIFILGIPLILFAITIQLYATPMKNLYLTIFYASPVY